MRRKIDVDGPPGPAPEPGDAEPAFKVTDRRHSTRDEADADEAAVEPARPTIIDEFRTRAEEAEQRLQEYIEAHKRFRAEQEQVRVRLQRDVERRVDLRFAELVGLLLETVDTLDLALEHARGVEAAAPLTDGVRLARDRFVAALEKSGVERVVLDGAPFDPTEAEAVRIDPVESAEQNGSVTETLRPGYRLGECLVRPAQVAVGRHGDQ